MIAGLFAGLIGPRLLLSVQAAPEKQGTIVVTIIIEETSTVTKSPTPTNTAPPQPCTTTTTISAGALIINEVAWAGTRASRGDEWIELYNPPGGPVGCVILDGWELSTIDGTPTINLTGKIPDDGYFLLESGSDETVSNIAADQVYTRSSTTGDLDDSGEVLTLYNNGFQIDSANQHGGSWPDGTSCGGINFLTSCRSMERLGTAADSDAGWVTYTYTGSGEYRAGRDRDGDPINGTPRHGNWILTVTPTRTRTPAGTPTRVRTPTPRPVGRPIINEYLVRPGFDWNQDGSVDVFDEFVEVMNIGPVAINIGNWRLNVIANENLTFTLPSVSLEPGQRMAFYGLQTNLLLTDGGGTVRLLNPSGQVWDAHTYGIAKEPDQSWCRLPDGTFSWFEDCTPTPALFNTRTGEIPTPPANLGLQPELCTLPDTLPEDFLYAECYGYGSEMWRSMYWDQQGWGGDQFVPANTSKWESFVE